MNTEPLAFERARAVSEHARYLGVSLSEFAVTVTVEEAFELLDWVLSQAKLDNTLNIELLTEDCIKARAQQDPWVVLNGFELFGMPVVRIYDAISDRLQ